MDLTRRNFLKGVGVTSATALAGCSQKDKNESNPDRNNTPPPVDHETRIEFLESHHIQTIPIVNQENLNDKAGIRLEVEDQNGLEQIQVAYNDEHRNEPLKLYDRSRDEFEHGVDGKMVPISQEFPQRLIAPKTGEFTVEATDINGNTETRTQEINNLAHKYRADRKRKADSNAELENIGNYSTERNWDNLTTNTEEIQQTQQQWLEQQTYGPLVDQVMSGEDLSPGNKIFPNWEGEDDGYFDQSAVKEEEDFETLIRWYLPLIRYHDRENYGNAPSGRNDRFATTMEKLINEHHPEAEAQSTSVKAYPAHGIFGVQDKNNEEFYLVDTTPTSAQAESAVGRIGDFITSEDGSRSELWDPFHEFEPGKGDILYSSKSTSSVLALTNFVTKNTTTYETEHEDSKYFITDEWMDDAYEILRNGGSIDPITEPIEEMIQNHISNEEGYTIGIYGNLDDTRIAVSSGDEIFEEVMYNPEPQTIDDIEGMLETA